MNNNFGSNSAWELNPTQLSAVRGHMLDDDQCESSGFDDMFNGPAFRASRSAFHRGGGNTSARRGQTFYRGSTLHPNFGLPENLASAHWAYVLPSQPTSATAPRASPSGPHRHRWR